mmetsp:Transcript_18733/g.29231  ORF Transcript_18733/g.29231 Transcript_18733/m.29231 type:complete len:240 (+) Transcript_18733:910-1629(+)
MLAILGLVAARANLAQQGHICDPSGIPTALSALPRAIRLLVVQKFLTASATPGTAARTAVHAWLASPVYSNPPLETPAACRAQTTQCRRLLTHCASAHTGSRVQTGGLARCAPPGSTRTFPAQTTALSVLHHQHQPRVPPWYSTVPATGGTSARMGVNVPPVPVANTRRCSGLSPAWIAQLGNTLQLRTQATSLNAWIARWLPIRLRAATMRQIACAMKGTQVLTVGPARAVCRASTRQ